ncbi:hypothetical protein OKW30_003697 [Paraburkholderia sp. Clong3]|uniref:hypothetical protein n=1 Tax=Paraburkholderia sp. Clong3 TaxID=2991061 RepID=UPI003D2257A8
MPTQLRTHETSLDQQPFVTPSRLATWQARNPVAKFRHYAALIDTGALLFGMLFAIDHKAASFRSAKRRPMKRSLRVRPTRSPCRRGCMVEPDFSPVLRSIIFDETF